MAAEIRSKAEPIMKQAGVLCLHPRLLLGRALLSGQFYVR
jgi:hypothetical protein